MKRIKLIVAFILFSFFGIAQKQVADSTSKDSLKVKGNMTVNGYLITRHIKSPDRVIHLGDSSMTFTTSGPVTNPITGATNVYYENMATSGSTGIAIGQSASLAQGNNSIAMGYAAKAYGNNSIGGGGTETDASTSYAFGWNVKTSSAATNAIALGTGYASNPMLNSTANSLAVGFNSNVPTFFVSGGNGTSGSLGNVGIGTTALNARLSVNGDAIFTNVTGTPTYAAYIKGNNNVSSATTPDYTDHFKWRSRYC
jgi:hypothetical protein